MRLPTSFRLTKDGKIVKKPSRKSVSRKIAERKNPKRRYTPAGVRP